MTARGRRCRTAPTLHADRRLAMPSSNPAPPPPCVKSWHMNRRLKTPLELYTDELCSVILTSNNADESETEDIGTRPDSSWVWHVSGGLSDCSLKLATPANIYHNIHDFD